MPVCTVCAHPAEYLYTTYKTKSNIRLGVCTKCGEFLDPLIEHPPLLLLLDLILLKPRVYLHLLFNRGSRPFDSEHEEQPQQRALERQERLRSDFTSLVLATVFAETVSRLHGVSQYAILDITRIIRMTMMVVVELAVQHVVTTMLALEALKWRGWYPKEITRGDRSKDGRQEYFHPMMISLTLLYTTLLPLALQLVLSIWYTHTARSESITNCHIPTSLDGILPENIIRSIEIIIQDGVSIWDKTDRIWAGTKLLGGMSAAFGLRVILPTKPWETSGIILAGGGVASLVGRMIEGV